jgi:hypothetical protein
MKNEKYYKVLNISSGASQKEIKAAYRKLSLTYHPDICSKKNTCDNKKWQEIIDAYEELTKPKLDPTKPNPKTNNQNNNNQNNNNQNNNNQKNNNQKKYYYYYNQNNNNWEEKLKKAEEILKRRRIDRIEETVINTIFLCICIFFVIYLSWCTFKQVTYLLDIKKNKSNNFYEAILGLICLIYFIILYIYTIYYFYNNLTMEKIIDAFKYYFME